jgi:hypothetical protein
MNVIKGVIKMKVKDWIQREHDGKSFVIRGFLRENEFFLIGDATNPNDSQPVLCLSTTPKEEDYRFTHPDIVILALIELYGREYVEDAVRKIRSYDEIKEKGVGSFDTNVPSYR